MGSSTSKPSNSAPHVWKGSAQAGVSQSLVESLETSNETDVSRLQALELHIQERVAAELRRLRAQEAETLREAQQKLSAEPHADQQGDDEPQRQLGGGGGGGGGPSRQEVSKAIEDLRAKLEERKDVRQPPDSLESARNEVVRCLREHDRRPLDCWREVEAFKEEVRRMEKGWVDKVVS
ncbi:hypothetical protein C8A00DRAFT_42215 [Chaetomidium leptoderma]|uniref:MICOS complex subunit mic19 n=1 Tax=Chaetomidium leptoderma TaxID=669021 RepID=A0AAN6VP17_9PEZI|nr:hypothetical protein C8A00DRAFT_42215 [Chaetomidium leptoderma]